MPRRVLDTNILINHWGHRRRGRPHAEIQPDDARAWATELISLQQTKAIVTPVAIEFLAGQESARAVFLAQTFLSQFDRIDQGRILPQDWADAERLARRVPVDRSRRQLGDCLIRAVCNRLGYEPVTVDRRFPG